MQRRMLDRLALALCASYLGAALVFAWASGLEAHVSPAAVGGPGAAPQDAAPDEGARLWALRCASCHDAEGLRHRLAARRGTTDPEVPLQAFLAGHGPATDTEDEVIAAWLLAPPQPGS